MSNIFFQNIFEALSEVIEDYQSHISFLPTVTHNAKAGLRWDILNTNIIHQLENLNIEATITKRGFWEMLIIYSKDDNCIYTLMRKNRLDDIISNPEKNAPIYLQALSTLNTDAGLANPELFEVKTDKSDLYFVLAKLCENLKSDSFDQKTKYKIITFDTDYDFRVIDLKLSILDCTCHLLSEENIMEDIKPVYSNEVEQFDENTDHLPELKLKKKAEDRIANQNTIELKDSEQENLKEA